MSFCNTLRCLIVGLALSNSFAAPTFGQDAVPQPATWEYKPSLLSPFWDAELIEDEPILFVLDPDSGVATGKLLFPIDSITKVTSSDGKLVYQAGIDYEFQPGSDQVTIPAGSRIKTVSPDTLRRTPGSQPYRLTHRDGGGEIMFGAKLEYHELQTWLTYRPATDANAENLASQKNLAPRRGGDLPATREKLASKSSLKIVLLGDSISTGCNASAWGGGAPFQPPFQDLLLQHLQHRFSPEVKLTNLSVGGMTAPWGISKIEEVNALEPDLVIIAFGMNDVGGFSPKDYQANIQTMIDKIRRNAPATEIILIATMLGNADWTALKHENFPLYRDALASLCGEGVALADMTTVWEGMLAKKKDADLTGNGVNHPNDFGHRVYAQVLSQLLVAPE